MKWFTLVSIITIICLSGCTEKRFSVGEDIYLTFSSDTIHFDTVFTSLGTATRELRVINHNKGWIRVDEIKIANENSAFRLNIDGFPGNEREDIEIGPGDSIFIFIDAIINPNDIDSPIAVSDSIEFFVNGERQDVNLIAWGQDINLINGEEIATGSWSGSKPYVVYNSMMVDTGEVLTIEEGVRVMFHRGSTMYIAGTLVVDGTVEDRVVFSSDRVEQIYNDIPGQWSGLYFLNGSTNNILNNIVVRNAVSAVHLGNIGTEDEPPDIILNNALLLHNSVTGISSLGATVYATNCVIGHCGFYSLFLVMGGEYEFLHCTINSTWDYSFRTTPGIFISDYLKYDQDVYKGNMVHSIFSNCSMTGELENEIEIISFDGGALNCQFNSCLIKVNPDLDSWGSYDLTGSFTGTHPGYISSSGYDFRPDTLSLLLDNGDPLLSIVADRDIRGYSRFQDNGPDIGAYERQIGETSK